MIPANVMPRPAPPPPPPPPRPPQNDQSNDANRENLHIYLNKTFFRLVTYSEKILIFENIF